MSLSLRRYIYVEEEFDTAEEDVGGECDKGEDSHITGVSGEEEEGSEEEGSEEEGESTEEEGN